MNTLGKKAFFTLKTKKDSFLTAFYVMIMKERRGSRLFMRF